MSDEKGRHEPRRQAPHELWAQADSEFPGDAAARRARYLDLMRDSGHLIDRTPGGEDAPMPQEPCQRCGPVRWQITRHPDCYSAMCPRCGVEWDIGWGVTRYV